MPADHCSSLIRLTDSQILLATVLIHYAMHKHEYISRIVDKPEWLTSSPSTASFLDETKASQKSRALLMDGAAQSRGYIVIKVIDDCQSVIQLV
jgi:hypothetical protein